MLAPEIGREGRVGERREGLGERKRKGGERKEILEPVALNLSPEHTSDSGHRHTSPSEPRDDLLV